MEIRHAHVLGGTLRDAETENARMLQRMESLARLPVRQPAPRKPRAQRVAERGVSVKAAPKEIHVSKKSPCARCGTCRHCLREKRVFLIIQKRNDDQFLAGLADDLFVYTLQVSSGVGQWLFMSKRDRARAITQKAEDICNASVSRLGKWD